MQTDPVQLGSPLLSVVVLTYNEEANILDCWQRLEGLACEIFVVDSGSDDRACQIAAGYGASTVQHPFENYSARRNWAQAALAGDGL